MSEASTDAELDELAEALHEEWLAVEAFRVEVIKDMYAICRSMHNLRAKLNEDMIQVLLENNWKEGEVTRSLAAATVSILKAVAGLDYKRSADGVFLEKCNPDREMLWDFQNGTA